MTHIREQAVRGLKAGDVFTVTRTFTENDTVAFGEISREMHPIHYDERFTAAKGFRGKICHGLLVGGMITEVGGQIGWLASGMNFRFRRPVYFGDTITCVFTITEADEQNRAKAEAVLSNQLGEVVVESWLTGILPGAAERAILAQI